MKISKKRGDRWDLSTKKSCIKLKTDFLKIH